MRTRSFKAALLALAAVLPLAAVAPAAAGHLDRHHDRGVHHADVRHGHGHDRGVRHHLGHDRHGFAFGHRRHSFGHDRHGFHRGGHGGRHVYRHIGRGHPYRLLGYLAYGHGGHGRHD